jgi:serine/threonine-protein kinase
VPNLYWRRADGRGEPERLTTSSHPQFPSAWHPSGRFLAFVESVSPANLDVMILPVDGDDRSGWRAGSPRPFANTSSQESWPAFSPDGRWLAYASDESGRWEVYVQPFPNSGGRWQVSTSGGSFPRWSRKRSELLYATPENRVMVVPYSTNQATFVAGAAHLWADVPFGSRFGGALGLGGGIARSFDLHPDGERIAISPSRDEDPATRGQITLIFNFFDEVRRIVSQKN